MEDPTCPAASCLSPARGSCWKGDLLRGTPQGHPVYQDTKHRALSPERASGLLRSPRGGSHEPAGFSRGGEPRPPPLGPAGDTASLHRPHLVTGIDPPGLHGGFGGHCATFGGAVQPHTCTGLYSAAKKRLLRSQLSWGHIVRTTFRLSEASAKQHSDPSAPTHCAAVFLYLDIFII